MSKIEKTSLNRVLTLTQRMYEMAEKALWDELIEVDKQRQIVIESTFPIEEPDQTQHTILQKIIELNTQIERLCSAAKMEVQQKLISLNGNKKAISAYQK